MGWLPAESAKTEPKLSFSFFTSINKPYFLRKFIILLLSLMGSHLLSQSWIVHFPPSQEKMVLSDKAYFGLGW
jgi:hypothetical protein